MHTRFACSSVSTSLSLDKLAPIKPELSRHDWQQPYCVASIATVVTLHCAPNSTCPVHAASQAAGLAVAAGATASSAELGDILVSTLCRHLECKTPTAWLVAVFAHSSGLGTSASARRCCALPQEEHQCSKNQLCTVARNA